MAEKSEALRGYVETLRSLYDEIIRETDQKSPKEVRALIEVLDNLIELYPFKKYSVKEVIHNISGLILTYQWRAMSWIIYEIITGHYFEALRDIRFLFESSLLALHYDYFIDRKIYETSNTLATIGLKAEIIELVEGLREKVRQLREEKTSVDLKQLVRPSVKNFVKRSKIPEERKQEYLKLYTELLAQPELYWSVSKIIRHYAMATELKEHEQYLQNAWAELSVYTHFSKRFFETALEKPEEIWIETYDEELLQKCTKLFIRTFDLFMSTFVLSFPKMKESAQEIVEWWDKNIEGEKLQITRALLTKEWLNADEKSQY